MERENLGGRDVGVFVDGGFGMVQDTQRDSADVKWHFILVGKN
jgi:hypothetical protein